MEFGGVGMPWLKPAINILMGGLHRNKDFNTEATCPWKHDCPQHNYKVKIGVDTYRLEPREKPLPSKLVLLEQVQPMVRLYKCLYCGMRHFQDVSGRRIPVDEKAPLKNPALIGGRKGEAIWR
jgi:hypothetical protein